MAAKGGARGLGTLTAGAGAIVGTMAGVGAAYQALSVARERQLYPPPGKRIDIGGYRLHITDEGVGGPTVVLDAGLAGFSLDWTLVRPEIARFTRVCAYDRAGYGWSDPGARPRDSQQIAMELRSLLHRAGVPGPYVLVGHSFGGFNMRVFADRYPKEVAGLVLVDASHEDFVSRLSPKARRYFLNIERLEAPLLQLGSLASRIGLIRLISKSNALSFALNVFQALPTPERDMAMALRLRPAFFATGRDEVRAFNQSAAQVRRTTPLSDNKPVIALTAIGQDAGQNEIGETMIPGLNLDLVSIEEMVRLRVTLHGEMARKLSPNCDHIITGESGHLIAITQPALVVESVRRVVESVRAGNAPLHVSERASEHGATVESAAEAAR